MKFQEKRKTKKRESEQKINKKKEKSGTQGFCKLKKKEALVPLCCQSCTFNTVVLPQIQTDPRQRQKRWKRWQDKKRCSDFSVHRRAIAGWLFRSCAPFDSCSRCAWVNQGKTNNTSTTAYKRALKRCTCKKKKEADGKDRKEIEMVI